MKHQYSYEKYFELLHDTEKKQAMFIRAPREVSYPLASKLK